MNSTSIIDRIKKAPNMKAWDALMTELNSYVMISQGTYRKALRAANKRQQEILSA